MINYFNYRILYFKAKTKVDITGITEDLLEEEAEATEEVDKKESAPTQKETIVENKTEFKATEKKKRKYNKNRKHKS